MIKDAVYLCIMHPDSVLILNTVGNVDVPSFLSCSALSMSSGDGNVLGNVTISFCKQEFVIYYIIYWITKEKQVCIECSYFEERIKENLSQWLRSGEVAVTGADLKCRLQTLYRNCKEENNVFSSAQDSISWNKIHNHCSIKMGL